MYVLSPKTFGQYKVLKKFTDSADGVQVDYRSHKWDDKGATGQIEGIIPKARSLDLTVAGGTQFSGNTNYHGDSSWRRGENSYTYIDETINFGVPVSPEYAQVIVNYNDVARQQVTGEDASSRIWAATQFNYNENGIGPNLTFPKFGFLTTNSSSGSNRDWADGAPQVGSSLPSSFRWRGSTTRENYWWDPSLEGIAEQKINSIEPANLGWSYSNRWTAWKQSSFWDPSWVKESFTVTQSGANGLRIQGWVLTEVRAYVYGHGGGFLGIGAKMNAEVRRDWVKSFSISVTTKGIISEQNSYVNTQTPNVRNYPSSNLITMSKKNFLTGMKYNNQDWVPVLADKWTANLAKNRFIVEITVQTPTRDELTGQDHELGYGDQIKLLDRYGNIFQRYENGSMVDRVFEVKRIDWKCENTLRQILTLWEV